MEKLAKSQFFIVKCELFDEASLTLSKKARKLVAQSLASVIGSKSSVKEGMIMVRKSPFKTAFVFDMEKG